MPDTFAFTTFDVAGFETTPACSLCKAHNAFFQYTICSDQPDFHELEGVCCASCAASLLAGLESAQKAIRDHKKSASRELASGK